MVRSKLALGLGTLFSQLAKIYSLIIYVYGLWVISALISLYIRLSKEIGKIPFSSPWWAFVFPVVTFDIATFNLYSVFQILFFKIIYISLYVILLTLWCYVIFNKLREYYFIKINKE
ncbi:MAG: Voltage-dependent anion channel [Candidatus Woesearchaeota archaeon]|nr:Voltage-dependent anion channel [Candidatus Woesearchaeota archaeon]